MKSDYTEGNAFQWSFFAPHDMDNFISTIGGKKELETRLDTLFTTSSQVDGEEASGDITGLIGQYAHGNEPSHHMAYLYNWTDSPWKGQERLDQIMQNFYTNAPDGIIGNSGLYIGSSDDRQSAYSCKRRYFRDLGKKQQCSQQIHQRG